MGQALYRKYRSKSLSEIIGQEHITETLDKALQAGRINHAYLFTGPRGVGKTSIARILAHEINGITYDSDQSHLDIIEIDAASNRRIDEIRELRDKVAVAPTSSKYKVYIIDEVHMLTKEAFNALLKTLEEPPAHVVFILATTDAHKLPETIVSRTQRFSFKPVTYEKVVAHLRAIAQQEKITVDDAALELLARHGEGSFRDSISMLDQASANGEPVTKTSVALLLGIPSEAAITELLEQIAGGSSQAVIRSLVVLFEQGYHAAGIAASLSKRVRGQLIDGSSILEPSQTVDLLEELLEVAPAYEPDRRLELALLRSLSGRTPVAPPAVAPVKIVTSEKPKATPTVPAEPAKKPVASTSVDKPPRAAMALVDGTIWPEVLMQLKLKYNTLYGVVRMANPRFEGDNLELAFNFAFHQKRLSEPKNKKIIADIIMDISGHALQIECIVDKDAKPLPAGPAPAQDVSAINSIFGGGELLK